MKTVSEGSKERFILVKELNDLKSLLLFFFMLNFSKESQNLCDSLYETCSEKIDFLKYIY